jgi:hypothetical protein
LTKLHTIGNTAASPRSCENRCILMTRGHKCGSVGQLAYHDILCWRLTMCRIGQELVGSPQSCSLYIQSSRSTGCTEGCVCADSRAKHASLHDLSPTAAHLNSLKMIRIKIKDASLLLLNDRPAIIDGFILATHISSMRKVELLFYGCVYSVTVESSCLVHNLWGCDCRDQL